MAIESVGTKPGNVDDIKFAETASGDSQILQPDDASLRSGTGFSVGEKPKHNNFNYLFNRYWRWFRYLSDNVDKAFTDIRDHLHTGEAGQCHKIALTNGLEVQGVLPFEYVEGHSHPELEDALEYLRIREDLRMGGAFIITFGGFETYQTIECFWWREQYLVAPASNKYYGVYLVTLAFESLLATSSLTSFTSSMSTNPTIPEEIWPRSQVEIPCTVINNGNSFLGTVNIHTNGIVSFSLLTEGHQPTASFSDYGQKGFNAFAVTYPVFVPLT